MGTLVRWLLEAFGVRLQHNSHLSSVSNTIDLLPVRVGAKFFAGGALHFVPVALGLINLFVLRYNQMHFNWKEVSTLVIAAQWCWLGPGLIWQYEHRTLVSFGKYCRTILNSEHEYAEIGREIDRNVGSYRVNRGIVAGWMAIVLVGFYFSSEYLAAFAIRAPSVSNPSVDWAWLVTLVGVILFSYYTALGFCFSYKTLRLIRLISRKQFKETAYHADRMIGFSYLGSFSFSTNMMFLSGLLFVPLIVIASVEGTGPNYWFIGAMVTVYLSFAVATVVFSIWTIHTKIARDKASLLRKYGDIVDGVLNECGKTVSEETFRKYLVYRNILADVRGAREWPLRLDDTLTFIATGLILPLIVALVSTIVASSSLH